jgi:hypothetical protein
VPATAGGGGTAACAVGVCVLSGSGGPESPKIESPPPCMVRLTGAAGMGAGAGPGPGFSSVPDTLILGSSCGAFEQPNTVHPPFSAKHSG